MTKEQIRKQLDLIQLGKFKKNFSQEIFSICSDLVEAAYHGKGGEQLWVGIVPGPNVRDLPLCLPTEEYPSGKLLGPNKWRRSIMMRTILITMGRIRILRMMKKRTLLIM